MTAGVFSADEWIDRLARALPGLAEAQEPYLQEYYRQNRGVDVVYGGRDGDPPDFPLDDLRDLYLMGITATPRANKNITRPCAQCSTPFAAFCGRIPRWSGL